MFYGFSIKHYKTNHKAYQFQRFLSRIFKDKISHYLQIRYYRHTLKSLLQTFTTFYQLSSNFYHFSSPSVNFCRLFTTVVYFFLTLNQTLYLCTRTFSASWTKLHDMKYLSVGTKYEPLTGFEPTI